MPVKIKYSKPKRVRMKGVKMKYYTASITIELPVIMNAAILWLDLSSINLNMIDKPNMISEMLHHEEETDILMYRALMIEAGYIPMPMHCYYHIVKEPIPPQQWTFPKKLEDKRIQQFLKSQTPQTHDTRKTKTQAR